MKNILAPALLFVAGVLIVTCPGSVDAREEKMPQEPMGKDVKVIYLHHSTGNNVWKGGVPEGLSEYNKRSGTQYQITEQAFPKEKPYGWKNYPYDYWNIWVAHAGAEAFVTEPTLEMLTKEYDVIVFKHCYPVAKVLADTGAGDVTSEEKRAENYKLQYEALKAKLREFPDKRFVVWTGAMLAQASTDEQTAGRAKAFFEWVKTDWDEKADNIYVWDFAALETGGGLYLKREYEAKPGDSHPGEQFCKRAAALFVKRLVDVIEGRGDTGSLTGE